MIVLLLALGVGLVTTVFTFVDAALLESLPYPDSERLVRIEEGGGAVYGAPLPQEAWPLLRDLEELDAAVYQREYVLTDGPDGQERLQGALVGSGFFDVLGVPAAQGRDLTRSDLIESVVVISHEYWQRRFDGDSAVGRTIQLSGEPFTVVGVMPRRVTFPDRAQFWRPLRVAEDIGPVQVIARLSEGVDRSRAAAALNVASARLKDVLPDSRSEGALIMSSGLIDRSRGLGPLPWIGLGLAGLVLLTAVSNIAGLLLVRSHRRRAEMAVRSALGGSRLRLIRQLLMESGLLGLAGAALGILVAVWGTSLLGIGLSSMPGWLVLDFDSTTLAFTAVVLVVVVAIIGVAPALEATGVEITDPLRGAVPGGTQDVRVRRLGDAQVAVQFAMAFVLVLTAGLFMRSLMGMGNPAWGIDAEHVVAMAVSPDTAQLASEAERHAWRSRVQDRMASISGVEVAAVVGDGIRLRSQTDTASSSLELSVGGLPVPLEDRFSVEAVTPGYFRTVGLGLQRGRTFSDADVESSTPVVVLSRTVAAQAFPDRDAVGRTVRLKAGGSELTVVGVASDQYAIYQNRQGTHRRPMPAIYVPAAQWVGNNERVLGRAITPEVAAGLVPVAAVAIRDLASVAVTGSAGTLEEQRAVTVRVTAWFAGVLGAFALVALLLALVGIYGVVAFRTAQRTREVGIRKAMGAQRTDVLGLFMGGGLKLVAIGAFLGLPIGLGSGRLLRRFLFQLEATDPVTMVLAFLVVAGTASLATWLPATRAAAVQPGDALRHEG